MPVITALGVGAREEEPRECGVSLATWGDCHKKKGRGGIWKAKQKNKNKKQPSKITLGKAHHQPEPLGERERQAPNTHQGTRRGWEAQSQSFLGLLHSDCELLS